MVTGGGGGGDRVVLKGNDNQSSDHNEGQEKWSLLPNGVEKEMKAVSHPRIVFVFWRIR